MTFAELEYDSKKRRTRREIFLEKMEGLIPSANPKDGYPNQWVEIPILTHLPLSGERGTEPMSRNHINVLSSDVIVALPGDAGRLATLSEVRLAVRYERPVIAFVESDRAIPGLPDSVSISSSLEGVRTFVMSQLGLSAPRG